MWYVTIIKIAGEFAAKEAIKQLGGVGAEYLQTLIFGEKPDEVMEYLKELEKEIRAVMKKVEGIELRQIFQDYNQADEELEHLSDLYEGQHDKPREDRDKQNTCKYILDINRGVSERARRMISAVRHINLPSHKTFLQEYSDILLEDLPDVYSYSYKMDAVMNHFRLNMIGARLLRQKCYEEILDTEKVTDLELTEADTRRVEQHYADIVGPALEVRKLLDEMAESTKDFRSVRYVRLQHHRTSNYLTAYEKGSAFSEDKPFSYAAAGMPQIYLYKLGRAQTEKYHEYKVQPGQQSGAWYPVDVKVSGPNQMWKVVKVGGDKEPTKFMFQPRENDRKALAGVNKGRIYLDNLSDDPKKDKFLWWQPIMAKNDDGKLESGVFMLKHVDSELALDSDGTRVYADNGRKPTYDNPHMRWSLVQKDISTLETDEFLAPGEELVSPSLRYILKYKGDGNLVLFNQDADNKIVWESGTAGKGAWRCVLLINGSLVVFDKDQRPVWESDFRGNLINGTLVVSDEDWSASLKTNPDGSKSSAYKLVVRDDACFEVIDRNNEAIYSSKWRLDKGNTLGPDEFLFPGEKLVSKNRRYVLQYYKAGNLQLFDTEERKALWDRGNAGLGAWRCVMQKSDGKFVIFNEKREAVWFTRPSGPQHSGSKLNLLDDGTLAVQRPDGVPVWSITRDGREVTLRLKESKRPRTRSK